MLSQKSKHSLENFRIRSIDSFARTDYFTRQRSEHQQRSSTSIRKRNIRVSPLKELPHCWNVNIVQFNIRAGEDLKRIIPKKLKQLPVICGTKPVYGEGKKKKQAMQELVEEKEEKKKEVLEKYEEKEEKHEKQEDQTVQYESLIYQDEQEAEEEEYTKAFWGAIGSVIVIKELKHQNSDHQMKMVQLLKHQHILRYFGAERRAGSVYIYSEEQTAGSLTNLITIIRSFPVALIKKIAKQLVSALSYVHSQNYHLHNLNPSKILLDKEGNIKLNIVSSQNDSVITEHTPLKSVIWKSPETILSNETSGKSNVWSVGCIVFQMITKGALLMFDWSKPMSNAREYIEFLREEKEIRLPNISQSLKEFVLMCLEYNPEARPSAAQLLNSRFLSDS